MARARTEPPPVVFAYLDARRYLGDFYAHKKAHSAGFSYRSFARRAGSRSPNHLKLVVDGDRNLTPETARKFAAACGLTGAAVTYFVDLVAFTQARTTDEKTASYERLLQFREHRAIHRIDVAYGQYHSRWYVPAVRELAFRKDFRPEPAWIAQQLVPAISARDAEDALTLLRDLGLLEDRDGRLVPGEPLVSTGPEVKGVHYLQYHRAMIARALAALDDLPAKERDISSVTLCLGKDALPRMKEKIRAFRRELLQLSADEADPVQVVQINLQLFPLSREPQEVLE